jgi:CheY-like chemotaxis protein
MKLTDFIILVVDDNANDRAMITRAFRQNGVTQTIQCVGSGDDAISYLKGDGKYSDRALFPYPSFIMSDLKMPRGDGLSVLQHLKSVPEWAIIPTLVFSASADLDDIKKAYMLGAVSYLVKPVEFTELRKLLKVCHDYWMECEIPQVDATGKKLRTASTGKLGERFPQAA